MRRVAWNRFPIQNFADWFLAYFPCGEYLFEAWRMLLI